MELVVKRDMSHFVAGYLESGLNENLLTNDEKALLALLIKYGFLEKKSNTCFIY